jgi:hypothetical protein
MVFSLIASYLLNFFHVELISTGLYWVMARFNSFGASVEDPGSGIGYLFDPWIRDPGWEKVSIRIRDPG